MLRGRKHWFWKMLMSAWILFLWKRSLLYWILFLITSLRRGKTFWWDILSLNIKFLHKFANVIVFQMSFKNFWNQRQNTLVKKNRVTSQNFWICRFDYFELLEICSSNVVGLFFFKFNPQLLKLDVYKNVICFQSYTHKRSVHRRLMYSCTDKGARRPATNLINYQLSSHKFTKSNLKNIH